MRSFYFLHLLLLPYNAFSMEDIYQNPDEPVGPGMAEVENLASIAQDADHRIEPIASGSASVVEVRRVVSDWELQRHIGNLLHRRPSYEQNLSDAHQQLLRDGLDVTLSTVQRNMLDYLLKRSIEWVLNLNYSHYSDKPRVHGAEAVLKYVHHARTGGFPGTTLATIKRLMAELAACDEDLALQLLRVKNGVGGSKDNVYQMLLCEGFQVDRARVETIFHRYRGSWHWPAS